MRCKPAVRYRGKDELGKKVTIVGYGALGNGKDGLRQPPKGRRRGGRNVIDLAGGNCGDVAVSERVLLYDFDDPTSSASSVLGPEKPVDLEVCGAPGDSGGGWYVFAENQWQLVAITSGFVPLAKSGGDSRYGTVSAGMRISAANEWIDTIITSSED